jgi:hypothetical protein
LFFKDIVNAEITLKINGKEKDICREKGNTITLSLSGIKATDTVEIVMTDCEYLTNTDKKQALIETIAKYQMGNDKKGLLFTEFLKSEKPLPPMAENYTGPIEEILALYRG